MKKLKIFIHPPNEADLILGCFRELEYLNSNKSVVTLLRGFAAKIVAA